MKELFFKKYSIVPDSSCSILPEIVDTRHLLLFIITGLFPVKAYLHFLILVKESKI